MISSQSPIITQLPCDQTMMPTVWNDDNYVSSSVSENVNYGKSKNRETQVKRNV